MILVQHRLSATASSTPLILTKLNFLNFSIHSILGDSLQVLGILAVEMCAFFPTIELNGAFPKLSKWIKKMENVLEEQGKWDDGGSCG